jgi:hypothetical protein
MRAARILSSAGKDKLLLTDRNGFHLRTRLRITLELWVSISKHKCRDI